MKALKEENWVNIWTWERGGKHIGGNCIIEKLASFEFCAFQWGIRPHFKEGAQNKWSIHIWNVKNC